MNKSGKTVSVLLLAAAILSVGQVLVSCGSEAESGKGSTDTQSQTEADTEEIDYFADRLLVEDGVPTEDYNERTFTILTCDDESFFVLDEGTGEVVGDALYKRTQVVEERFNIDIIASNRRDTNAAMRTAAMSGDDDYQLFLWHMIEMGQDLRSDIYRNWYEIPYVDFSKPWWPTTNTEDLTYNQTAFVAFSYIPTLPLMQTTCYFFNKQIAADYDIPDMYEIVNSGRWTADMQMTLCKDVYKDLDGNGKQDERDLFGYAVNTSTSYNGYVWSFGEKIVKRQNDGTMYLDYYNDRYVQMYQKLMEMSYKTEGAFVPGYNYDVSLTDNMFINGQVLFHPTWVGCWESLRNVEWDYGIIPFPKLDEAQTDYYSMVGGGCPCAAVPVSIKDEEFVGSIIEAMEAESWKRIIPAYIDVALKVKGARDETSIAMLDYIYEHIVYDFGYIFGGYYGPGFWPQYMAQDQSADIASYYAAKHKTIDKLLTKAIEYYEDYDG